MLASKSEETLWQASNCGPVFYSKHHCSPKH